MKNVSITKIGTAMDQLRKFGELLLNHVVNDARTSQDSVIAHLQEWDMAQQEAEMTHQQAAELYETNHEAPRRLAITEYDTYARQQQEAFLRYEMATTEAEKKRALDTWLRIRIPEDLMEKGVHHDFVYTKDRVQFKSS